MRLEELLEGCDAIEVRGDREIDVRAVAGDSRACGAGSLFVAVPGLQVDGADFIPSAIGRGAVVVVTERPLESFSGMAFVRVRDARRALAVMAANFYGRPAGRISLIGVTGTSGKTTTTRMIESMIDATGQPAGLIGTIEYRAGSVREIADRTTPDAVLLQKWFRRMVDERVHLAVMEVSSHALKLDRTFGVPFRVAVFTNLSRDHFDFHVDFEDYFGAKQKLFDQIDRSHRSAIVNVDDEYGRRLAADLGASVITFGMGAAADIHPDPGFESALDGLHGSLQTPWGAIRVESELIGQPNLMNWMAAAGAALLCGVERAAVEIGIQRLKSVKGRFERLSGGGLDVLIDYAHKPDALEKLLRAVRDLAPNRRIVVVFGCGGDRDAGKRPVMGEIAGRLAHETIITSDNPRSESPERIVEEIVAGIETVEGARWSVEIDRRRAIERAIEGSRDGDLVVIAGKGHESYQVIGDRIIHFDDTEEAVAALRKREEKS